MVVLPGPGTCGTRTSRRRGGHVGHSQRFEAQHWPARQAQAEQRLRRWGRPDTYHGAHEFTHCSGCECAWLEASAQRSHVRGHRCRARIRHDARFGALINTSVAVSSTRIFRLPSAGEANLRFRWCSAGSGGPDRRFSAMATRRGGAVVALQRSAMVNCGAARDVHRRAT
jgi:hypothetical protein